MKVFALAIVACITGAVVLDILWPFWLIGLLCAATGIAVGSDNRTRDRRFKTGYKGNAPDTSDPVAGRKFVISGIFVFLIGVFARPAIAWFAQAFTVARNWWDVYGWYTLAGIATLLVFTQIARRWDRRIQVEHTIKKASQKTNQAPQELIGGSTDENSKALHDAIRILLYVGKADGQLRAPEKAVIRETRIPSLLIQASAKVPQMSCFLKRKSRVRTPLNLQSADSPTTARPPLMSCSQQPNV